MKCPTCHKFLSYTDDNDYNRKCRGHIYIRTKRNQIVCYKFVCRDTNYVVESYETETFMYYSENMEKGWWEEEVLYIPKHIPLLVKDEVLQTRLVEEKLRKYLVFS